MSGIVVLGLVQYQGRSAIPHEEHSRGTYLPSNNNNNKQYSWVKQFKRLCVCEQLTEGCYLKQHGRESSP